MEHKYAIGDKFSFDQGDKKWHRKDTGIVERHFSSPVCLWYSVRCPDGKLVEVEEKDVTGPV